MSFNLYWRPLPAEVPAPDGGYQLKWAIARRFGEHDGSCKEGPFVFTTNEVEWLQGVVDGGAKEAADDAKRLIGAIRNNPQGVTVWIGDPEDA